MGQKVCKCVQAERANNDRSDVYTLLENSPAKPTADATDDSRQPAIATDGDEGDNRDESKKTRFWRKSEKEEESDRNNEGKRYHHKYVH